MSAKHTGGPAFPLKEPLTSDSEGMTLRDYFAAKAISTLNLAAVAPEMAAEMAYKIADAMLKVREA